MSTPANDRKPGSPVGVGVGLLLLVLAPLAVRVLIIRGDHPPKAAAPGAVRSQGFESGPTAGAGKGEPTVDPGSRPATDASTRQTTVPPALAASSRPRSPLERSPGYYPPDDPESMSVITGRRDAPLVDLDLAGGASSKRDLAMMLLAGLNARDERALHALRITRKEFEVILWPEFPESRPVTNITAEDAWEMSIAQSVSGAGRAIGGYGARQLELVRVECDPPTPYKNFTLHRGVTIVARDQNSGETERMRFAPTFVERHGRYKVLTFKD